MRDLRVAMERPSVPPALQPCLISVRPAVCRGDVLRLRSLHSPERSISNLRVGLRLLLHMYSVATQNRHPLLRLSDQRDAVLPQHLHHEVTDMARSLQLQWECRICIDFIGLGAPDHRVRLQVLHAMPRAPEGSRGAHICGKKFMLQ